jgi:hypothetical protein
MALPLKHTLEQGGQKAASPCFLRASASASNPSRSVSSAKLVLATTLKSRHTKGHCDVASLWISALDDDNVMGMRDGE